MSEAFPSLFARIRAMLAKHAPCAVLLQDEPARYHLGTHELRAKDGYRTYFAGVEVKSRYVAVHLMPVYVHPDLLDTASAKLRQRMQGKSCFNFRSEDAALLAELELLVNRCAARFRADGRLEPPPGSTPRS